MGTSFGDTPIVAHPTLELIVQLARLYRRRLGQEYGYRFDKQDLLWANRILWGFLTSYRVNTKYKEAP